MRIKSYIHVKKPLFKGIAKNKTEFLATAFIEDKNTNDADTK